MNLLDTAVAKTAGEVEQKPSLPEPVVSFVVGETWIEVTTRYPLDYDESLARKSKKSLVVGETQGPVPVTFDRDGETYTLTQGDNIFAHTSRLVIRMEDKKAAESAEDDAAPEA